MTNKTLGNMTLGKKAHGKKTMAWLLVVLLIILGTALVACGSGDSDLDPNGQGIGDADTDVTDNPDGDDDMDSDGSANGNGPSDQNPDQGKDDQVEAGTGESFQDYAGKVGKIQSLSYEEVYTFSDSQTYTMKYWVKGPRIRSEMIDSDSGEVLVSIVDVRSDIMYVYYPESNTAMLMDFDYSQHDDTMTLDGFYDSMDFSIFTLKEKEVYDGKNCAVFETEEEDGSQVTLWIWEEKGLPLKLTTTTGGEFMTIEYKNLQIDSVKDSLYELPDDVELFDFTQAVS